MSFADDAVRVLSSAGLADSALCDVERPSQRPVSGELRRMRAAGRAAYERAMAARGVPAAVYASAHWLWDGDE